MSYSSIHLDLDADNVATITLNRPDNLNALNFAMLDEMRDALGALAERGARCLLLTGAGRGFSSGADLGGSGGFPDDVGAALEAHFNPLIEALFELPHAGRRRGQRPLRRRRLQPRLVRRHRDRRRAPPISSRPSSISA